MIHVNPDLSGGIISQKNTGRFFTRLWPAPVCIREKVPGVWDDVRDIGDDFSLAGLVKLRDLLVGKCKDAYPDLVALIMRDEPEAGFPALPAQLRHLQRIQRRIGTRQKMLACIPSKTRRLICAFPEGHFALLQFLYACPNAEEMIHSNPALATMVASSEAWCSRNSIRPPDTPWNLARMKRMEIMRALGFRDADQRLVHILSKIMPWACRREHIAGLIDTVKVRDTARLIRHMPRINLGAITLLADTALLEHIGKTVLFEVINDVHEDTHANTALKLRAWIDAKARHFPNEPSRRFTSRAALDEMVFRNLHLVGLDTLEAIVWTLPPAPIPDHRDIVALRESGEVFQEGYQQSNCLFSRMPEFCAGTTFAYRVLAPERATLTIRKCKGQWQIDALETACNGPVSDKTKDFIHTWLHTMPE